MSANRSFKRVLVGALVSLLFAAPAVVGAQESAGDAQGRNDEALRPESHVRLLSESRRVTIDDVQRAHYHVSVPGVALGEDSYELAFMERDGKATILNEYANFNQVALTSRNIPDLVNSYLHMGAISGILGSRREFTVGDTYDSVMLRPEGGPHFRTTCDRKETIAGVAGYHLVVRSVKFDNDVLEMVLSPDYPFPLFVKELTGANRVQIALVEIRALDLAMVSP